MDLSPINQSSSLPKEILSTIEKARRFGVALAETELQTSKSLENVTSEIQNIQHNNSLLYNQITTLCSSQIEEAKQALALIDSSVSTLSQIKKEYQGLKGKAKKGQKIIKCYQTIRKAYMILSLIGKTKEWIIRLLLLKKEVNQITQILKNELIEMGFEEEAENYEDEGDESFNDEIDLSEYGVEEINFDDEEPHYQLIAIFERIVQLEEFKLKVFEETSKSENNSSDLNVEEIFSKYLSIIDGVSVLFQSVMEKYFQQAVPLACEQPEKFVKIVRIIERDERKKKQQEIEHNTFDTEEEILVTKYSYKNYKELCFKGIKEYIGNCLKHEIEGIEDLEEVFERIKQCVEGELEAIDRHLTPCFPVKYCILEKCILFFDEHVREYLLEYNTPETDNITRSYVLKFVIDYPVVYEPYEEYLENIKIDYTETITDIKAIISTTFLKSIMEWKEKLIKTMFSSLEKEDEKSYIEQDGFLYTFGPIDFFTTLNQALLSISQCGQKDLIEQVAYSIRLTLTDFKADLSVEVRKNMKKISIKKLCALSNDSNKCVYLTHDLQDYIAEALPDIEIEKIRMDEVTNGFTELAKELLSSISDRITSKLTNYMDRLFTKDWYVVGTEETCLTRGLSDIQGDIQYPIDFLEWENVVIIVKNVFSFVVKQYIEAFMTRKFSLKEEERNLIRKEISSCVEFLPPDDEHDWVSPLLKPLRMIEDIFETIDDEDLLQCLSDANEVYPDMGPIVFETIIQKAGFSKEFKESLLQTVQQFYTTKTKLKQAVVKKPSIFGVYNLPPETTETNEKKSKSKESKEKVKKDKKKKTKKLFSSASTENTYLEDKESKEQPLKDKKKNSTNEVQEINLLDFIND
ncbi:hypothetical protein ABK040_013790 [Willaertia magna]